MGTLDIFTFLVHLLFVDLPSSVKTLLINVLGGHEIPLRFPENCSTNLRFLNIGGFNLHSYRSIGHGKHRCSHNRLEIIDSILPPLLDHKFFASYKLDEFTVQQLEDIAFRTRNVPKKLLQVTIDKRVVVNPKYRASTQRFRLTSQLRTRSSRKSKFGL